MKKTAFFVTSLNSGGIENYLLRFLNHFEDKIAPTVICKGNVFGELEKEHLKVKGIKLIKMQMGYFNILSIYKLYKFLKVNQFDSVCDFTGNFSGIVLCVSKFVGVKKRLSFYRGSTNHFKETKIKLVYNSLMLFLVKKYATKILSNSKAALDYFYEDRNKNDNKFKVIYNGINAEKFRLNVKKYHKLDFNIPENAYVIGHTGRCNSAKNHKTILKVAEEICKKYTLVYFVLCGKNTDVYLKEQVELNPILKEKVKLLGYRKDVSSLLTILDLYFFPSITEGQPNALIESMVSGLPIVSSNIKAIIETTPKEVHKYLKDPLDVDGFVNLIDKFYVNKEKPKENFSSWATKEFNPNILFNKFFIEL